MIPLVVDVADVEAGTTEQFAFSRSPVRIGRGKLNDLRLLHPFVSSYHGLVQFDDQEARYLDLGSMNGSTLQGVRLAPNAPVVLAAGAQLLIGTLRLTFARRPAAARPAATKQLSAPRLDAPAATPQRAAPPAGGDGPAPAPPAGPAAPAEPSPEPGDAGAEGGRALRLLNAFVEPYLGGRAARGAEDAAAVLPRAGAALQTFARCFLDLRRERERFGAEMGIGIGTPRDEGPIGAAGDAAQLLRSLLDPDAPDRERELERAFAELVLHDVALLAGVVQGAQALVERCRAAGGGAREFPADDEEMISVLFGEEFERAYAAIANAATRSAVASSRGSAAGSSGLPPSSAGSSARGT